MTLKRMLRSAAAVVLALACLLTCACSTPKVAMEVGGKVYEMGDYLAYAYGTAMTDSNAYIYLYYYGEEALSMDFPYGEDDKEYTMEKYLIYTTRDMMVRQKALEDMLKDEGLEWDKELLADAEEDLKALTPDQYLSLGFNNQRYIDMYKAINLNESSLFDGLYNKGGKREVKEEDIRKYFDENYLSYYMFEISLVDDKNAALSDEIIADYQKHFDEYLATFNKSKKTPDDFQVIYRKFLADTEEKKEDDKETKDAEETTETKDDTAEDTKEEEKTTQRVDVVKEADGVDEELVKAIEKIGEGEAKVVTYKQGGTKNTLALIFRMDPEADRGQDEDKKDIDYYEDTRDQTLQYMKYEEFNAEVEERVKELKKTAVIDWKAMNRVNFVELLGLTKK